MPPAAPRRALRLPRSPLTVALSLLAVVAVVTAIVVVGPEAAAESPGRVVTAKRGVIQSTVSGTGNLQPAHQVDLSFATAGTVKRVYVKAGEHVATGQLIARIDDARQRVAVAQAQAALDSAKTTLQDAEDADDDATASATDTGTTTASAGLHVVPADTRGTSVRIVPVSTQAAATTTGATPPAATTPAATPTAKTATNATGTGSVARTGKQQAKTATTTTPAATTTTPAPAAASGTAGGSANGASGKDAGGSTDGTSSASGSGSSGDRGSSTGTGSNGSGSATTVAAAQADVTSAELNLKDAQEALEHTRLRAPTAGTITAVNGAVGDSVSAAGSTSSASSSGSSGGSSGGTGAGSGSGSGSSGSGSASGSGSSSAFASLAQLSRLDLEVSFSESDIGKLKVGQAATVTVTALENTKLAAKVTSIGILSTSSSGVVSYPVTLAVTQTASGIRPGMSATAEVVVAQATGISVPSQALTGSSVTVKQNGKQTRRSVVTGVVGDSTTQIVSGLKSGEQVVLPALSVGSGSSGASGSGGASRRSGRLGGGGFGGGGPVMFSRGGPGGPG